MLPARVFAGPFAVADGPRDPRGRRLGGAGTRLTLACAVGYLRALEAGGIALERARSFIYFASPPTRINS